MAQVLEAHWVAVGHRVCEKKVSAFLPLHLTAHTTRHIIAVWI
jgi:hypothetical protein